MTILAFPDKREQLLRLAKEFNAVVIFPSHRKTARDCILEVLGNRVPMTTVEIAAAANVSYSYTQALLTTMRRDGTVIREKSRRYGGWLLAVVTLSEQAA